jgi:hypothetical protein
LTVPIPIKYPTCSQKVNIFTPPLCPPAKGGAGVGSVSSREGKWGGPVRGAGGLPIPLNSISLKQCFRKPRQEGI